MSVRSFKRLLPALLILIAAQAVQAQLDSIHWIPPMHARSEWGPQYLYISTPEVTPFPVEIRDGQGAVISTLTISNAAPQRFTIGTNDDTYTLVPDNDLHKPLQNKGLILVGPQKFYVNFRAHSSSQYQACDLTCKGRAALGKTFRIGHLIQGSSSSPSRSNFVGVMATEDSTLITLSDYDPSVRFRINGSDTQVPGSVQLTLQAGESAVLSQYISSSFIQQPPNGLIGSLLESSKPIAVDVGSWTGAPVNDNANDVGIDQIVPYELVGEEYILCRGNGSSVLEIPVVVAHVNGTSVFLNGSTTPAATLNAGEFFQISTSAYTSAGNLYILTSQPTFMYQMVGGTASGDDQKRTAGLIFVPPISCSIPNAVDNIYQPNQIGSVQYDGGLMIVAMKDSTVTLRIDGVVVPLGTPDAVQGNPDFVTYRRLTLFAANNPPETASIIAQGAVQVALFGRNGAAGFGGFYSGFSKTKKPDIGLQIIGDGVCPDTLVASGRFDGVQWYFADSLLQYGPDTFFVAYSPGLYTARGYLGVCRRTDYAEDDITAQFNSPEFPYTLEEPSCYGFSDGEILFGMPTGGLEPYQFSVDNGQHFSSLPNAGNLPAGNYKLVVRDSTGCYNRPLAVSIGQPDSLGVDLVFAYIQEPVKIGEQVILEAQSDRDVILHAWDPLDTTTCGICPRLTVRPEETTWYTVTVTDAKGCSATDRIQVVLEPNIYVPNVFAPASEIGNDHFTLFSKEPQPIHFLRIYDRWGSLVFERNDIVTNDLSEGWDGTCRGEDLNPGVFVFVAEIEYAPGRKLFFTGDVTLVR
ncbi:MAG TPA: gliding motility-associated C-terminal domain-containing protein [Saprospiraceae bacterium]|nr:gliding motility-associated C-terminal domain-containing protein [Saprospiraceae bacterium]